MTTDVRSHARSGRRVRAYRRHEDLPLAAGPAMLSPFNEDPDRLDEGADFYAGIAERIRDRHGGQDTEDSASLQLLADKQRLEAQLQRAQSKTFAAEVMTFLHEDARRRGRRN